MKVTMLLADSAQAEGGKLYILGGGWSIAGPGPLNFAIALKLEVPWDQANRKQKFILRLEDQDGQPVEVEGKKVEFGGELEVGRPPGLLQGIPLDAVLAINFQNLLLPPGSRYLWRLFINGGSKGEWTLAFGTRSAQAEGTAA
jgi:hypothetical protein